MSLQEKMNINAKPVFKLFNAGFALMFITRKNEHQCKTCIKELEDRSCKRARINKL